MNTELKFIPLAGAAALSVLREADKAPLEGDLIQDFTRSLEEALEELQKDIKKRETSAEKIKSLKNELEMRGFWQVIVAKVTSKDHKEASEMLKDLGGSLHLTQSILRIVLKLQTQKNYLLHTFNEALVDKIERITGDTRTLGDNQKSATLAFLGELQEQINDQIRQHQQLEHHQVRLQEIDEWKKVQQELTERREERYQEVGKWQELKDAEARNIRGRIVELEKAAGACTQNIANLESRLAVLEQLNIEARSFKTALMRNLLPIAALALGITALVVALR